MTHAEVSVLHNLAVPHLRNAINRHFSVQQIECDDAGKPHGPFFDDMRADWISCILSCGGAAETFLNDRMEEASFSEEKQSEIRNEALLKRTKLFLRLSSNADINIGALVFQQMKHVYDLRSAALHYKPHWSNQHGISQELEAKLPKCKQNPFAASGDMFFPGKCISSGYSYWAIRSTLNFIFKVYEAGAFKRGRGSFENFEQAFERGAF